MMNMVRENATPKNETEINVNVNCYLCVNILYFLQFIMLML